MSNFNASPATIPLGQRTTIAWTVRAPRGCTTLRWSLHGRSGPEQVHRGVVGQQGTVAVAPVANTSYELRAWVGGQVPRTAARLAVNVLLPEQVTIDRDDLGPLLSQALGTPNTTVRVLNGVDLDLSRYKNMPIAQGVTLLGGRTSREPGGRLYTTKHPERLLVVRGDGVRIAGLRIQGADLGVAEADADRSSGIYIDSRREVEVADNEIYGWRNAAIGVRDDDARIAPGSATVHIHGNFIHHNQRKHTSGYGVVVGNGGFALIDRNVFDYNRHAIAGDGSDGSGYRAYRNLVLQHGGRHRKVLSKWFYTHQFDMHGQRSCGVLSVFSDSLYNCGTAGHHIDVRHNSFLYTRDEAIRLRGTPQLRPYGAFVVSNVFAHRRLGGAVAQNEKGLFLADNRVGIDGSRRLGRCDFDGDGIDDSFMATGTTWWYSSRQTGPWTYLNSSRLVLSQLRLGQFDSDGRCDVASGELISSGGTGPLSPR